MDILLDVAASRLPESGDATEVALELLEADDFWIGLVDVGSAKAFDGHRLTETVFVLPTGFASDVLQQLDLHCREPKGDEKNGSGLKPEAVVGLFSQSSWVYDPDGCVSLTPGIERAKVFVSDKLPRRPHLFRHLIEVRIREEAAVITVDGTELPVRVPCANQRFHADLTGILDKAAKAPKGVTMVTKGPGITLPDMADGKTTLARELAFYHSLLATRMSGYKSPKGSVPDGILQILLTHSEEVEMPKAEAARLTGVIGDYVRRGQPVPITLSFALGTRIPNPLKFREIVSLPTLGWVYLAFFFRLLQEKVRTIYKPGLRIVIFDEATLFASLMGVDPQGVNQMLTISRRLFKELEAPVEVKELKSDLFPWQEVEAISVRVDFDQTYAIACSLPAMVSVDAMADLYVNRDRDYAALRRLIGEELWREAETKALVIAQHLAYRKKAGMFVKLTGLQNFIDACITDKVARIVFDVTANALLNHGMPVVYRSQDGGHKMHIVPECRVANEHPGVIPVRVSPRDFGFAGPDYVFYYTK
ncbi:MAG: hypothetical protein HY577_02400 [Candidatus Nealsonbacteria bacterium]|nr:hypothetical protein [Candidatus Nealsonbacteria bacterium]